MFLSDIFTALETGELSQIFLGDRENGGIEPCDYPKVVSYINLGLTSLYKRFPLKIGDVVIRLHDEIQTYYLDPKYAVMNVDSTERIKYIHDSEFELFKGGVNKIEEVFNELGETLFLNDMTEYWSVFTPTYNSIQVPWPDKANQLTVQYRADHDNILLPGLDPETEEVHLPYAYLEALLNFVGARAYTAMNADQDSEGNNYATKYEQSCALITDLNLMNSDNTTNTKLDRAGWV